MDSRRISAALGFALLIGCVIGIVILIHNSRTTRSGTSAINVNNRGNGKEMQDYYFVSKKKKENGFANDPNYRSSQPTMQEMNELADELHRFLGPKAKQKSNNGTTAKPIRKNGTLSDVKPSPYHPSATTTTVTSNAKKAVISAVNYKDVPGGGRGRVNPNIQSGHPPFLNPHLFSEDNPNEQSPSPVVNNGGGGGGRPGKERAEVINDFYKTPWLPSTIPIPPGRPGQHPGMQFTGGPAGGNLTFNQHYPLYNHHFIQQQKLLQQSRRPPFLPNHRNSPFIPSIGINSTRPGLNHHFNPFRHPALGGIKGPSPTVIRPSMEEHTYEDFSEEEEHRRGQPTSDNEEWEEYDPDPDPRDKTADVGKDPDPRDFIADFQTLFDLANHLYHSKPNSESGSSVFQGFLKVINETIQRGNNSRLLANLNEMYRANKEGAVVEEDGGIGIKSRLQNSSASILFKKGLEEQLGHNKTMTPYETSLTAFVFMSFGIFLLNQIHNFVQKSSNNVDSVLGRGLLDEDMLDWFKEPFQHPEKGALLLGKEPSSLDVLFDEPEALNEVNGTLQETGRSFEDNISSSFSSSRHVNNMFRGLLNMVNAYTKNNKAMECIWSLYCQDLDLTAGKRGLYGVAARINSVGLRLIMNQIPTSLTLDVILRSLVGWDGLPCRKMFPACAVTNGTFAIVDENNVVVAEEEMVAGEGKEAQRNSTSQ